VSADYHLGKVKANTKALSVDCLSIWRAEEASENAWHVSWINANTMIDDGYKSLATSKGYAHVDILAWRAVG